MNLVETLAKEMAGKDFTLEEKARYIYIRCAQEFTYDPRYFFCDKNEPPRCRADGVSQGVTTSSIIGYSPIHNLDFLHIPRLLLRLYSYPLLQQNSRLSKIPRPIIFL